MYAHVYVLVYVLTVSLLTFSPNVCTCAHVLQSHAKLRSTADEVRRLETNDEVAVSRSRSLSDAQDAQLAQLRTKLLAVGLQLSTAKEQHDQALRRWRTERKTKDDEVSSLD